MHASVTGTWRAAGGAGGRAVASLLRAPWARPWPVWLGAVLAGVSNVAMFAFARAIGVFPQMSMWGATVWNRLGLKVDAPFVAYPIKPAYLDMHSLLAIGVAVGALMAALLSREFKIRAEAPSNYLLAAIGGVLMGFGTVITPPCNVGGFFSATMALSLSGPVMAAGLLAGAYVGGRLLRARMERAARDVDFGRAGACSSLPPAQPALSRAPVAGVALAVATVVAALLYLRNGLPKHAGLLLFGAWFGIIFQRSRLCFVSAFREIFVSRDGTVMKWVLLAVAIGTVGFAGLKAAGYQPMHMVLPVGLHTLVGGFIFGVGMSLAGYCGVGCLWRCGEGYVRAWIGLVAGALTAGSWTLLYGRHVGEGWLYGRPVFLPDRLGYLGAVAAVFAFLAVFYLLIRWAERGARAPSRSSVWG